MRSGYKFWELRRLCSPQTTHAQHEPDLRLCALQGSGDGEFARETQGSFDDGEWHYVTVERTGNRAVLSNNVNRRLASVEYGQWTLSHSQTGVNRENWLSSWLIFWGIWSATVG